MRQVREARRAGGLVIAASVAIGALMSSGGARAADRLFIYAGEMPIGAAWVDLSRGLRGGGTISNLGMKLGTDRLSDRWFKLDEECGASGEVLSLRFDTRDRGVWVESFVSVASGVLRTRGRTTVLTAPTYGVGCLLLRTDPPGTHVALEPALHEEYGLIGRVELDVLDAGGGSRKLVSRFTDRSGADYVEEAVIDPSGRLVSARSTTMAVRYGPGLTGSPRPFFIPSFRVPEDLSAVCAILVDIRRRRVEIRPSPLPSLAIRHHVIAVMEETRLRWEAVAAATCVDFAETAFAALRARGLDVALVTGWVAVEGSWQLHRWVKLRDGATWITIDPALGQVGTDATHVPLVEHGTTPEDRALVEKTLATWWASPPVLVSIER